MKFSHLVLLLSFALLFGGCKKAAVEAPANTDVKNTAPVKETTPASSKIGDRITITVASLPKPFETGHADNPPKAVPAKEGVKPNAPEGFEVTEFSSGDYENPRLLMEGANGDLFLADMRGNKVYLLRDTNKDGKIDNASERFLFAENLNRPFGLAINKGYFYIGNTDSVVRGKYQAGMTKLEGAPEKIADLPTKGHSTRNLLFNPEGTKLYVAIGSESNVSVEPEIRATICEYNPDGTGQRIYASGIRNPVGLVLNPVTKEIWTCVNERDGLGDDLVPDYVTSVKDGGFYGWPYYYLGNNVDPRRKDDLAKVKLAEPIVPDVLIEAHGAATGMTFYTGTMFPKEYQGNAFVALHGSWNRSLRNGYKIVRIPMKDGKPEGGYINFMNGWITTGADKEVWGRPSNLMMKSDGSLLIVDDVAKKIWRVTYKGSNA
ncbi:MAG TPA: sorbosone dehydrogenase family protein [Blastocatellia bacterium]|nr:sorbosone dehydrogenase family protein [Blastocatellia bacterium]